MAGQQLWTNGVDGWESQYCPKKTIPVCKQKQIMTQMLKRGGEKMGGPACGCFDTFPFSHHHTPEQHYKI